MTDIYVNGQILPDKEAKISVWDRSYLFGEGLFESFRSYDGKFPFLKDHLQRMEWSSTFINLPFPDDVDFSEVCGELLERNELDDARFKIVLSRNDDPNQNSIVPETSDVNLVIFCLPLKEKQNRTPYRLKVIKSFCNTAAPLSAIKSTNYLVKVMGRFEAKDTGYDDGILLNAQGHVTEATTANIFWVDEKNMLRTVAEEQGLLGGITKKKLFALLKEKKIEYREDRITPDQLSHSREIFITNSILGIKPVSHIDHRQISGGEAGPVTHMIMDLWEQKLKEILQEM